MHKNSAFRFYSLGYAAHNKPLGTHELSVVPYEVLPLMDGEVDNIIGEIETKGKDAYGKEYEVKIKTSPSIVCTWIPMGALPITAPDIRRGERVAIYRFGDSNEYHWVDEGLDRHLRRLETIIWRVSALPEESGAALDDSNCYYFTISSHQKLVMFQTSTANGEPHKWTIQLDLEKSIMTVTDDADNYVQINSTEQIIRLQNTAKAFVELNRQNINMYAPRDIFAEAANLIQAKCKEFILKASKSVLVDTPKTTITGDTFIQKDLTVTGKIEAAKGTIGGVSFENGEMKCTTLTATAPITAPNV